MRRDGDRLVEHLASARREVLICAPFIKAGVFAKLLAVIPSGVTVRVVTRWRAKEVAAGVSDLEVFQIVSKRIDASLWLLDRLHAKIYVADDAVLIGSANLTGTALGWSDTPNLELLTDIGIDNADVCQCLNQLNDARIATADELERVRVESQEFPKLDLADDAESEEPSGLWLPRFGAPGRLYQAYTPNSRERLSSSVLEAAVRDLGALGIPPNLSEAEFTSVIAQTFATMPAVQRLLSAADDDLNDERGVELIDGMPVSRDISSEQQWLIVREWMTTFLADRYEIAPASFIVRRRPGGRV